MSDVVQDIANNYNQLKSNIDLNDFSPNVKIHKKALSNKTKRIKMWVPIKSKTGGFSIYNNKDKIKNKRLENNQENNIKLKLLQKRNSKINKNKNLASSFADSFILGMVLMMFWSNVAQFCVQ